VCRRGAPFWKLLYFGLLCQGFCYFVEDFAMLA
jgi:hypothetical protein